MRQTKFKGGKYIKDSKKKKNWKSHFSRDNLEMIFEACMLIYKYIKYIDVLLIFLFEWFSELFFSLYMDEIILIEKQNFSLIMSPNYYTFYIKSIPFYTSNINIGWQIFVWNVCLCRMVTKLDGDKLRQNLFFFNFTYVISKITCKVLIRRVSDTC